MTYELDRRRIRRYRRCPCGRLFPLVYGPGRPPTHCPEHRTQGARMALRRLVRVGIGRAPAISHT